MYTSVTDSFIVLDENDKLLPKSQFSDKKPHNLLKIIGDTLYCGIYYSNGNPYCFSTPINRPTALNLMSRVPELSTTVVNFVSSCGVLSFIF